jgi:hypothetical protein
MKNLLQAAVNNTFESAGGGERFSFSFFFFFFSRTCHSISDCVRTCYTVSRIYKFVVFDQLFIDAETHLKYHNFIYLFFLNISELRLLG